MKLFSTSSRTRLRETGPRISQGYSRTAQKVEKPGKARSSIRRGPGKSWLTKPAVVYRGEKEICNPATVEGRAEYKYRTMLLWLRQDAICCFKDYDFCPGMLHLAQATFQHQNLRGKDKDERIWDPKTKEPLNGAAHGECNLIAGSRRLPIFHGSNFHYELREEAE